MKGLSMGTATLLRVILISMVFGFLTVSCNNFLPPQPVIKNTTGNIVFPPDANSPKNLTQPENQPSEVDKQADQKLAEEISQMTPEQIDFDFVKKNLLEVKCLKCHQAQGKAEDLPFQTRNDVVQGSNDVGESLLVVGSPDESLFYLSLLADKESRKGAKKMPSEKAVARGEVKDVTPTEIHLVELWIKNGAR
ncbi:MAG: hypothetical protein HUU56_10020 [Bdellovibrionaceae bacterium]|nr:hypothetical protein [Pseudobdellovibrionaceae bacterium]